MQKLEIKGGKKISGTVAISGSKNATLPILAATILTDKKIILKNIPIVRDVETMAILLSTIGSNVKLNKNEKKIEILKKDKLKTFASYKLLKTMRAGVLVLGPLLAKFGNAKVSLPGGCSIGTRPIDIHLNAFKKMGAKIKVKDGYIIASANKGLKGCLIKFPKISVGATENLIIAASMAEGITTLSNCAIEPEIKDLVNFINCMGGKIKWIGKRTIKIEGVKKLNRTTYTLMGDRIETISWAVLTVLTGGKLKIGGFKNIKLLKTELDLLKKIGASIKYKEGKLEIKGKSKLKSVNLETKEYPGFSTDAGPLFGILLCKSSGRSILTENIFENRLNGWVAEARRLGAKIQLKGNKAIIEGNTKFQGAEELMSSDLRASVALCLAAISSSGQSIVNRIYMLDRGMENFEKKARSIGVNIKRIS